MQAAWWRSDHLFSGVCRSIYGGKSRPWECVADEILILGQLRLLLNGLTVPANAVELRRTLERSLQRRVVACMVPLRL